MENEILHQILSELKDIRQGQAKLEEGQAKLEKDIKIIKEDVRFTRALLDEAYKDILMLDKRTESLKHAK